jgi:hypothetical protein
MLNEDDWPLFAAACEIKKRVNIHIAESVPIEPPDPRAVAFFHEFVSSPLAKDATVLWCSASDVHGEDSDGKCFSTGDTQMHADSQVQLWECATQGQPH